MSEQLSEPIVSELLTPGNIIEFSDISELPEFEDLIAQQVDPSMTSITKSYWDCREHIKNRLRPTKFNGRISDIQVSIMEDPYDKLSTAKERGWKFGGGRNYERGEEFISNFASRYVGLNFTANAISSGRGIIGQLQAEIYYFPTSISWVSSPNGSRIHKSTSTHGGATVVRAIAKPKLETDNFIKLDLTAKRIGFEVLRNAMANAKIQPIRN